MSDDAAAAIEAMIEIAEEKADAAGLPKKAAAEASPSPSSISNCSACDMS